MSSFRINVGKEKIAQSDLRTNNEQKVMPVDHKQCRVLFIYVRFIFISVSVYITFCLVLKQHITINNIVFLN